MSYVYTSKDFINRLRDAAAHKTLYVNGAFGAPATDKNKKRYSSKENITPSRKAKILTAPPDTYFFDCVCLIKGILWGWCADPNDVYGGAIYRSNGVDDLSVKSIAVRCQYSSQDFSSIIPGEFVWLKDYSHCGIYLDKGLCIECTPFWTDGVLYSWVQNYPFCYEQVTQSRKWYSHGRLPWIDYSDSEVILPRLDADGIWGPATTKRLQQYLRTYEDGIVSSQPRGNQVYLPCASTKSWEFVAVGFGSSVIRALQRYINVDVDGFCGKNTVAHLQLYLRKQGYTGVVVTGKLDRRTVECLQYYLNDKPITYDWYEK